MKKKVAAPVADAFQDSEYFLPKIAFQDQLDLDVELIINKERARMRRVSQPQAVPGPRGSETPKATSWR
jgi:hypothetical protein